MMISSPPRGVSRRTVLSDSSKRNDMPRGRRRRVRRNLASENNKNNNENSKLQKELYLSRSSSAHSRSYSEYPNESTSSNLTRTMSDVTAVKNNKSNNNSTTFVRPTDTDVKNQLAQVRDLVTSGIVKIEVFNQLSETARQAARTNGKKRTKATAKFETRPTAYVSPSTTNIARIRTQSAWDRGESFNEMEFTWRRSVGTRQGAGTATTQTTTPAAGDGSRRQSVGRMLTAGGTKLTKLATNIVGSAAQRTVSGSVTGMRRVSSFTSMTSPFHSPSSTTTSSPIEQPFQYKPLLESHLMMFVFDHANGPVRKRWVRRVCVCYSNELVTYRASAWRNKNGSKRVSEGSGGRDGPTLKELSNREDVRVMVTPMTHAVKGRFTGFFTNPASLPTAPDATYLHPVPPPTSRGSAARREKHASRRRSEKREVATSMFSYGNSNACSRIVSDEVSEGAFVLCPDETDTDVEGKATSDGRSFVFSIFDDTTTYLFAANSAELRDYWVSVLKRASQNAKAQAAMHDHPVMLGRNPLHVNTLGRLADERLAAYRNGLKSSERGGGRFENDVPRETIAEEAVRKPTMTGSQVVDSAESKDNKEAKKKRKAKKIKIGVKGEKKTTRRVVSVEDADVIVRKESDILKDVRLSRSPVLDRPCIPAGARRRGSRPDTNNLFSLRRGVSAES